MAERFDVYTDAFLVSIGPFGANLSFEVREPHPDPQRPPSTERLGTIRMSVEHLKLMAMMIRNQIRQVERQSGVKFEIPSNVLGQLGIAPEDWETFWRQP